MTNPFRNQGAGNPFRNGGRTPTANPAQPGAAQPEQEYEYQEGGNPFRDARRPTFDPRSSPLLKVGSTLLTTAGKALQPFMAPQQVLFGGIGAIENLIAGKPEQAIETWKRGLGAAGDYLTYGLTARKGVGNGRDDRETYVGGYELAKNAGAPDWLAKPVGLAADFFVDVPLIGQLGKVSGISKALGVSTDVNHLAASNMAYSFTRDASGAWDTAGLRKFAIRVAAAPLSTAPIHDLTTGLPAYYRQRVSESVASVIEEGIRTAGVGGGKRYTLVGGRSVPKAFGREAGRASPLGATVVDKVVSSSGGLRGVPRMGGEQIQTLRNEGRITGTGIAEELEKFIYRTQSEAGSISLRAAGAGEKYQQLVQPLAPAAREQFNDIAYRLLDWDDATDFQKARADLANFSRSVGDPGFTERAMESLWQSAALDTYMGLLRYDAGRMSAEQASGYYQGLRRFERATFGQPKTDNPLAPGITSSLMGARTQGLKPLAPDPGLHFRRAYKFQFQPEDVIERVKAQALPDMIHQVDSGKLTQTFANMLGNRAIRGGAPAPLLVSAQPQVRAQAATLAADFEAMFKGKSVDERTSMSTFLSARGYGPKEFDDILAYAGQQWFQHTGIAYRPPTPEVVKILRGMDERGSFTSGAGTRGVQMGVNQSSLAARQDMPDWLIESMEQIKEIDQLLDQTKRIGAKQYTHRSVVKGAFDFLQAEGGILTKKELDALPGGAHTNWRLVDESMAQRLRAMGDQYGGAWGDVPFKGDEYIPAAYHNLLVGAQSIDDPQVLNATLAYLMQAWKAHKVGSAAAIVRDTATNFRFASDFGIRPDQMVGAMAAAVSLRNQMKRSSLGVMDETAAITYRGTTITWKELAAQGGMVHGSFLVNELDEPFRMLRDNLAANRGGGVQGAAAAILDYSDHVRSLVNQKAAAGDAGAKATRGAGMLAATAVDLTTGLGGPVTKMLGDVKGTVDVIGKMGVYIHKRSEGMSPEDATRYADELLFNYQNQPLMVDYLRRNGFAPFAAFQFMSAGRFMRNMYENPYAVARWYRTPQSLTAGDERTRGEMKYTTPDYMRKQLWIPIPQRGVTGPARRDDNQRSLWFNLGAVMPESSLFSMTGSDAISQWVPPYVDMAIQIATGQGYQGMPVYAGGATPQQLMSTGNYRELARGVAKSLHTFGASPWAPGSPMAERLAKSIAAAFVPEDQIMDNPWVQNWLKVNSQGVFAAPLALPIAPQRLGSSAPLDVPSAATRFLGGTISPVTGTPTTAGSARGGIQARAANIDQLKYQMYQAIKDAGGDPDAIQSIMQQYMPLIYKQVAQIERQQEYSSQYPQASPNTPPQR